MDKEGGRREEDAFLSSFQKGTGTQIIVDQAMTHLVKLKFRHVIIAH